MRRPSPGCTCVARARTRAVASPARLATMLPNKSCEPPQCRDGAGGIKLLVTQSTSDERRLTLELNGRAIEDMAWTYPDADGEHADRYDDPVPVQGQRHVLVGPYRRSGGPRYRLELPISDSGMHQNAEPFVVL